MWVDVKRGKGLGSANHLRFHKQAQVQHEDTGL